MRKRRGITKLTVIVVTIIFVVAIAADVYLYL